MPPWVLELPPELLELLRKDCVSAYVLQTARIREWDKVTFLEQLAVSLAKNRDDLITELHTRAVRELRAMAFEHPPQR